MFTGTGPGEAELGQVGWNYFEIMHLTQSAFRDTFFM
jgi:hypothetical protein